MNRPYRCTLLRSGLPSASLTVLAATARDAVREARDVFRASIGTPTALRDWHAERDDGLLLLSSCGLMRRHCDWHSPALVRADVYSLPTGGMMLQAVSGHTLADMPTPPAYLTLAEWDALERDSYDGTVIAAQLLERLGWQSPGTIS